MDLQERVAAVIYRAIDEVNAQLPPSDRLEKTRDTVLFGREGGLDSLTLVNLIVTVEGLVEKDFGRAVPLSIAEMLFEPDSPFSNVGALGEYIVLLLEGRGANSLSKVR